MNEEQHAIMSAIDPVISKVDMEDLLMKFGSTPNNQKN